MARSPRREHFQPQTRPYQTPSQAATVGLLRTADTIRRYVSSVVEPHGVTIQQYNVLRILRGAGPNGLPTLSVGERMVEHTPGITRLIDRLESKKLVRRERCMTDRRRILCHITESGMALLSKLDEPVKRADEAAVRGVQSAQLPLLISLLDQVRAAHGE
jgi:MarR family transcriptional regulator, organic hydroperoxide resistance regulator